MTDTIQITEITHADVAQLADLHQASFINTGWSHAQICSSITLRTTQGFKAVVQNEIVGFILFQLTETEAEILTFCVHPKMQRQKIGEALLRETIKIVTAKKCGSLFLEVAADNIPACNLYRKAGFTIIGKRPNYYSYGNTKVDALMFQLTPFATTA